MGLSYYHAKGRWHIEKDELKQSNFIRTAARRIRRAGQNTLADEAEAHT